MFSIPSFGVIIHKNKDNLLKGKLLLYRGEAFVRKEKMNSSIADSELKVILDFFGFPGILTEISPLGNGHINDTLLLCYSDKGTVKRYVLQKINKFVFNHPDELMENTMRVTEHIRRKLELSGGDCERGALRIVPASNGDKYYIDSKGDYWRVTKFVENTVCLEAVSGPEEFYECGLAFGTFQSQLADYPAETLYYTIPGFHDTRARYQKFKKTVEEDRSGRLKECREEAEFILRHEALANWAMEKADRKELPIRVTHNDTKLNNVMFDERTGKAVCVLDLDTVMPGLAMNDYGDAIRYGACTAAEDEKDLEKVHCDLALVEAYTKGFIEGCSGNLTDYEIDTLHMGAIGLTYEQAMRFLTDFLEGDVYFKTDYPEHNLVRTRTQIKMERELEKYSDDIQKIIKKYK